MPGFREPYARLVKVFSMPPEEGFSKTYSTLTDQLRETERALRRVKSADSLGWRQGI